MKFHIKCNVILIKVYIVSNIKFTKRYLAYQMNQIRYFKNLKSNIS